MVPRDVIVRPSRHLGWVVEFRKSDGRVSEWWFPTKGWAKAVGRRLSDTELNPLASLHVSLPPPRDDGTAEASGGADSG